MCGIGLRHVAVQHFDRVIADLVAMGGDIGINAGLEVLALNGERTRERTDHANLDHIGIGHAAKQDGCRCSQNKLFHHSSL